jgi:hypothetical protein
VEVRDEVARTIAVNKAVGIVAVGWMLPGHSRRTFAAVSPVADTAVVRIGVADADSGMAVLHRERCYVAAPRPHLPASSLRSCVYNGGARDSRLQQSQDLRR